MKNEIIYAEISKDINDSFETALCNLNEIEDEDALMIRGKSVKEIVDYKFVIENPIRRFLTCPYRYNNIMATVAEVLWVFSGRNDLGYLSYFLPNAADFSDNEGQTWGGAYGPRLRYFSIFNRDYAYDPESMPSKIPSYDQIKNVIETLKEDPFSRQAIIEIAQPDVDYDHRIKTKDRPCTLFIQFLIRDGKLDCFVKMRSNDVMWGCYNINVFEWTFLQEIIAGILNVEVGYYNHNAVSFHLYMSMNDRVQKMINAKKYNVYNVERVLIQPIKFAQLDGFYIATEHWMRCIEKSIADPKWEYNEEDAYNYLGTNTMPYLHYLNLVLAFIAMKQKKYEKAYQLLCFIDQWDILIAGLEYFIRYIKRNTDDNTERNMINKISNQSNMTQDSFKFIIGLWDEV